MDNLKILITGVGAPGIKGTIFSLKNNFDERQVTIIGTDINNDVVGKYFCDNFYIIPRPGKTDEYLQKLFSICKNEKIDAVVPQNTAELLLLAKTKKEFNEFGAAIVVSNEDSIRTANNKFKLLQYCENYSVPYPKYYLVNSIEKLKTAALELGWPENKLAIKPPISNGMRGLRIIDEKIDKRNLFFNEKPNSLYIALEDLYKILGDSFPELIISEYLPGEEYTVDVLRTKSNTIVIPRRRDLIRSGITFAGTTVENKSIIKHTSILSEKLNLENCFGFQFKLSKDSTPKILECNPRVQGTMVLATMAGANVIYGGVKNALGESLPNFTIKWGTRIHRYWGGIAISNDKLLYDI